MTSDLASADVFPHKVDKWMVTEETLVEAYLSANQSIAAGSWTRVNLDTEVKDELGEFDTANHVFNPNETGWYLIAFSVHFGVGADQDRIQARVRDGTAGENIGFSAGSGSGTNAETVTFSGIYELTGGHGYALEAINLDSADTIYSGETKTFLHIRRMFR